MFPQSRLVSVGLLPEEPARRRVAVAWPTDVVGHDCSFRDAVVSAGFQHGWSEPLTIVAWSCVSVLRNESQSPVLRVCRRPNVVLVVAVACMSASVRLSISMALTVRRRGRV